MRVRQAAILTLTLLVVAAIAGCATSHSEPPAGPPESLEITAGASPFAVAPGDTTAITATVTSAADAAVLVNIEVRIPAGEKVYQQYYDDQVLAAGRPAEFRATWQVPQTASLGTHIVLVGVFSPGWGTRYYWADDAAEIAVTADRAAPVQPPAPGRHPYPFATLGPGSALPSGEECAASVRRSSWEPRPDNAAANRRTPPGVRIDAWGGVKPEANDEFLSRIDGRFTGTTDEIIQWAACKWGFDVNNVRAVAVKESSWRQGFVGDNGDSFGLLQVKRTVHTGTYPWAERSTALNVDYALAWRREIGRAHV